MKPKPYMYVLVFALMLSFVPTQHVRADVAPPETPPGANVTPSGEVTQVRMVAETVVLDIRQDPADEQGAVAYTTATFTMRNLGTDAETMRARFPLSFAGGESDGFGNYPEIEGITVKVNGKSVRSTREMQLPVSTDSVSSLERDEVPWSVFDVTFPPGEDVTIDVKYMTSGFGYYPYEAFKYILETGAGWKDTIGSADIIVRLPYEATRYNIWLPDETTGYSQTTAGAELRGNEAKWHFENLEPTAENNIEVSVVAPSLWQKVLNEKDTVTRNPNDGEAWGRLGKAYKEIAVMSKGYPRSDSDSDGLELLQLSRTAYEECLALLPDDSLWQFGYADLLWSHYYFNVYMASKPDTEGLFPKILIALKTSLELDPNNQRAKDLLQWISFSIPDSVWDGGSAGYVFLALTATPQVPTPYWIVSETPTAQPTEALIFVSPTSNLPTESPSSTAVPGEPSGNSPLCGGTAFILPLLLGALWWKRRVIS